MSTWAVVLRDAMGDMKVAQLYEASKADPEGPVQRSTITNALNGTTEEPQAKTLRVLCRVLGLNENVVRAQIARPEVNEVYTGPEKSRELTSHQRRLLDDLIDQMVGRTRDEMRRGSSGGAAGPNQLRAMI